MRSFRLICGRLALVAVLAAGGFFSLAAGSGRPAVAASAPVNPAQIIRAAKRGDVNAQVRLAWMYANGKGVPQHDHLAATWSLRAAEAGHAGAQFELGLLYNSGRGVPQDLVRSYMWLSLSAVHAAGDVRDFRVQVRDSVASKMTISQIELAQQMARAWNAGRRR